MAGESPSFLNSLCSLCIQCLQISSMVCAAPPSFVLSDVDLSDIFVEEELFYKAAAQPHDVVLFYSAVAAPFRRSAQPHGQIRWSPGQASKLAETSSIAKRRY